MLIHSDVLKLSVKRASVQFCYMDPPFFTQKVQQGHRGAFSDVWLDLTEYLDLMEKAFSKIWHWLKPNGSLMVHVDERTVHDLALILRNIFPVRVNEIIWCYQSGGAGKRNLAKKHDTILWVAKSPHYKFNVIREPYANDYGDRPGFHPEGRMLNDWWTVPFLSTTSHERTGYPNQKPLALLDRIIKLATDRGDTVLDPFCGSGTTAVAAYRNKRKFICSDKNVEALRITVKRLRGEKGKCG